MDTPKTVRMGKQGRLVIPSAVRERLGLEAGDVVEVSIEGGKAVIVPQALLLDRLYRATAALREAESDVVQELIDERRAEAASE